MFQLFIKSMISEHIMKCGLHSCFMNVLQNIFYNINKIWLNKFITFIYICCFKNRAPMFYTLATILLYCVILISYIYFLLI